MTKTILILAANPKNTPPLRLDQEVREIENGLQRARKRDEFILKQIWAIRNADFRRAMLDLKPNIVHFCGHGSGEEGIVFEDENGQAKLVSTAALSEFFNLFADKVGCVILNACYSELQAESIAKHIPYVIGMKRAIGDAAAIEFAVAFYDALGAGESIEFSYKLACNAIHLAGLPEYLIPILKTNTHTQNTLPDRLDHDELDLLVGIGETFGHDYEKILEFHSFYKDTDITNMFVQVVEIYVSRFIADEYFKKIKELDRSKLFNDSRHIGKTLKHITSSGSDERVALKPNESAFVLFLENVPDSEFLCFGFDTVNPDESTKKMWQQSGMYEVHVDVYGKVYNEVTYRKRPFVVLINFEKGLGTEIERSILERDYRAWFKK